MSPLLNLSSLVAALKTEPVWQSAVHILKTRRQCHLDSVRKQTRYGHGIWKFKRSLLTLYYFRLRVNARIISGTAERTLSVLLWTISIISLMNIENRALWLARSFALSRYNHCAVIITLKASSFQNGSQIFWCFGVGNWSILLFSRIIINVIILKQLVASGDVNIGE